MTPRVLRQSNLHTVQELREVLAGVWGLGPWNRGEKDIQTESLHHGQEVPEGRAPAPLRMPLGITIVLQVRNIGRHGTQSTCTSACTGAGLGAAPGYWISTGFLRWKARPATSWELDLGSHQRVRQLLSVFVSSLSSPGPCGLCSLPLSQPLLHFLL